MIALTNGLTFLFLSQIRGVGFLKNCHAKMCKGRRVHATVLHRWASCTSPWAAISVVLLTFFGIIDMLYEGNLIQPRNYGVIITFLFLSVLCFDWAIFAFSKFEDQYPRHIERNAIMFLLTSAFYLLSALVVVGFYSDEIKHNKPYQMYHAIVMTVHMLFMMYMCWLVLLFLRCIWFGIEGRVDMTAFAHIVEEENV
jgi:hypothetical protein